MTSVYVVGYDAIRVNIPLLPKGAQVYAGYSSGSGDIPWSEADFAAHATGLGPCLRIDQDPSASDATADILDVEGGAATPADSPWWAKRAAAAFKTATRPGQRTPAVYCDASTVTAVVNALVSGGVTSGVGLIVANWSLTETQAAHAVLAAAGPFPVVGVQFADDGDFDVDVFSRDWLIRQSGKPAPPPAPVPVPSPVPAWQEAIMNALPTLSEGAVDQPGHVFFVHRLQALIRVVGEARGVADAAALTVDGDFGAQTGQALKGVQAAFGLAADGLAGPQSWSVLLTGTP